MIANSFMDQFFYQIKTRHLNSNQNPTGHFIIYGAGNFGKTICALLKQKDYQVLAFIDKKAVPGDQWNGIPIYSPDYDGFTPSQKNHATVLVAIHNRNYDIVPITRFLKKQGYGQVLNPVEFFDTVATQLGNRFWLTSPSAYHDWQIEITQGYTIWEDVSSRLLYLALLQQRIQGDYSALPLPDTEHQYFPLDVPPWRKPLRFVDCGAYDGDTLHFMKKSGIVVETVAAFEPDLQNFCKLSTTISTEWNLPVFLFPCGVYSKTEQLRFTGDGGEGGKLDDSGTDIVQMVAVDDALPSFHPNLIKMDIEGAEIDALLGAKNTIESNKPGLAICVYHHPQHLWQIPLLIKSWDLGYKFFLRSHAYSGFEVVMYGLAA